MLLTVAADYLWLPVDRKADTVKLHFLCDGAKFQEIDIRLGIEHVEYYTSMDTGSYIGKAIEIKCCLPEKALDVLCFRDDPPCQDDTDRPQVHFTAGIGWINDPNGLICTDGIYHLFHQWNPYGTEWGNMHWGHAVSHDLISWERKGIVMAPDSSGTLYSGCGWQDKADVAGFGRDALLFFYTASGGCNQWSIEAGNQHTQHLAVSTDGGATLQKQGIILPHIKGGNRDPKVFYHSQSNAYIMVLFLDDYDFALFRSQDLIHWHESHRFSAEKMRECPDLFELPVENEPDVRKWVFWSADGYYMIGRFDGYRFSPESEVLSAYSTAMAYAAQTYAGVEDRVISMAWLRTVDDHGNYRGMMSVPNELSLVKQNGGYRVCFQPVRELWKYFTKSEDRKLSADSFRLNLNGEPTVIEVTWEKGQKMEMVIGNRIIQIQADGCRALLLVDRGMVEYWADGGTVYGAVEIDGSALNGCIELKQTQSMIVYEYCKTACC